MELEANHAVLTLGEQVSGAAETPFLLTLAVALPAHERTVKLASSDTLKISQWLGAQ